MASPLLDECSLWDDLRLSDHYAITETTLKKARDTGMLRAAKVGHRYYYRGPWILTWLETISFQKAK